jgi:hypothetical protein
LAERGDNTKARIADLAAGWSVDSPSEEPPKPPTSSTPPPTRAKPRTSPPPPPGSAARQAIEDKIIATKAERDDSTEHVPDMAVRVARTATEQLRTVTDARARSPINDARAHAPTAPPEDASTGPRYPRAGYQGSVSPLATDRRAMTPDPRSVPRVDEKPFAKEQHTPAIIVDDAQLNDSSAPTTAEIARLPTATGELLLDDAEEDDDDTQRKEDPVVPPPVVVSEPDRGEMTPFDPQTAKFDRGDPTADHKLDATEIQPSTRKHPTGGTLRSISALRRKRGVLGDVRYVFTAVMGMRRARRELAELDRKQELRNAERKKYLVTLGRAAVTSDAFDHPALTAAGDALQRIEEERGRHAGAVAASDAELERVRRDREAKAKKYAEESAATDAELAAIAKKLEPLEKEAAGVKKRAAELRDSLQRIEKKIAETEALRTSVKAEKMDKAAIEADIATYKADRLAVLRDEPVIAAELDALNPRIAACEASRAELLKKKQEIDKAEKADQGRTLELLDAIGAKRKVVERAASEAEQARDAALFELGERLYVDRPKPLANLLSPIDAIDLELGEGERRTMELREILSNIDKAKFARGAAMIILVLALTGCFVWWLLNAI